MICDRCGGSGSLPVEGGGRTCMTCEGAGHVEDVELELAGPNLEDVFAAAMAEGGSRMITITSDSGTAIVVEAASCSLDGPFAGMTEDEIVDELAERIIAATPDVPMPDVHVELDERDPTGRTARASFTVTLRGAIEPARELGEAADGATKAFEAMAVLAEALDADDEDDPRCFVCDDPVDEAGALCPSCASAEDDDA